MSFYGARNFKPSQYLHENRCVALLDYIEGKITQWNGEEKLRGFEVLTKGEIDSLVLWNPWQNYTKLRCGLLFWLTFNLCRCYPWMQRMQKKMWKRDPLSSLFIHSSLVSINPSTPKEHIMGFFLNKIKL